MNKGDIIRSEATRAVYLITEVTDNGFVHGEGLQTDGEGNLIKEKGQTKKAKGASLFGPVWLVEATSSKVL